MRVILNGAGGRMGHEVCELLMNGNGDGAIAASVDKTSPEIILKNMADVKEDADVIIDFSHHSLTNEVLSFALGHSLPVVIATTGQTDEEAAVIREAARTIPVFFSANMSLGVAVLVDMAKKAAVLFPDADIEIVEAHHNRKADAPSGTAKMLADAIKTVRSDAKFVYGRHGMQKREPNEIGIHALRMGNEPGMHQVIIATDNQVLTLEHRAANRTVFAEGAVAAAKFLMGKPAGLYTMKELTSEI